MTSLSADVARFSALDREMMERALQLARQGIYTTTPNPRVGCVLTRDDAIVGEGWHRKAGEPHAEVLALQAAGNRSKGATAYVTLEPCSHHGRTPPCADALIKAGVARVVCAVTDPNPKVNGQGLGRLCSAGITVDSGLMEHEARILNKGFFKRLTSGLPWVTVKIAASLDGRVALANGASRWITSEDARRDVQRLRARSCALVTGIGTVLADDPRLTVRDIDIDMLGRQPQRVICDTHARTPPASQLLKEPGNTLIYVEAAAPATDVAALQAAGAEVARWKTIDGSSAGPHLDAVRCAESIRSSGSTRGGSDSIERGAVSSRVDSQKVQLELKSLLENLAHRQMNEVLVEAGPRLSAAFIAAGLVDELVVYMAPVALGADALSMLPLPPIDRMGDRLTFRWHDVQRIGPDLKLTLQMRQPGPRGDQ